MNRLFHIPPLIFCIVLIATSGAPAQVGLLRACTPAEAAKRTEYAAARAFAVSRAKAVDMFLGTDGRLLDDGGRPVIPADYPVLWYHQGDVARLDAAVTSKAGLATLKQFASDGGSLLLSGAGLALVHSLGVEPVRPRMGGPGPHAQVATVVPLQPRHPVFKGLAAGKSGIRLVDGGYPAYSDWHGRGGPAGGMLLGRSPGGENPLAEYAFGKGRIIVMGWRLAHFDLQNNPHRKNLEKLTLNILGYLGERAKWQKVTIAKHQPLKAKARAKAQPVTVNWDALELAVRDLTDTFGARYPRGDEFLRRLKEQREAGDAEAARALQHEALLANPLLDFEQLLVVRRNAGRLGLPRNWQSNSCLPKNGYDNEIALLDWREGTFMTLFRPEKGEFVGDVDLHFDATRLLFSMPGTNGRWQVHELHLANPSPKELPLIAAKDVDNYDACYLPSGNIIFGSTAPFVGVPCVRGGSHVSNLYLLEQTSGAIRRLTFDQDHDWCPTVLNSGRVLYLRWEYSDIPHYVSRILFHMNPDGTEQMEYYGSNSYWPNAMFYARPIPHHPSRFVAVVGGHHDDPRMGELVLFDSARGRHEADGALQRIPGHGKPVEPIILDGLVRRSWPKFLHPWPLSAKYFLVSARPSSRAHWGIYLVDVFDNMTLIKETLEHALLEPVPLRAVQPPPVVPDKVQLGAKDATIYCADIYTGDGLKGVPRGTVKQLRVITYHFAYRGMGGQVDRVGLDGPWDIKRVLGTVPVEPDGSFLFRAPANTPIAVQPLDAEGKAVQLMRSWMTAMPGEVLSCVGCHEKQNTPPPAEQTAAVQREPSRIAPWYGPTRGFSFEREVQPVLDGHCVRCHDGGKREDGKILPNFTTQPAEHPPGPANSYRSGTRFSPSYLALRRHVRSATIESDMHLLPPYEFHADTARVVRMLRRGHQGVKLAPEAWDRLVTWIDLNTPYHGTWHELCGEKRVMHQRDRRHEMLKRYAGIDEDPEAIPELVPHAGEPSSGGKPVAVPRPVVAPRVTGAIPAVRERVVELGEGLQFAMCYVPAGELAGVSDGGQSRSACRKIDRPFWIGKFEVTNEQFARFDPDHDSRLEHGDFLQFSVRERGYPVNGPKQPVCRVSRDRAAAFCGWLSERTGETFALPTEAQWEWACRAGTDLPLWYGGEDVDFAPFENLADKQLWRVDTFGFRLPSGAVYTWRPAVETVDDGHRVSAAAGSYKPNPWGLHDMHGNVAEWTRTTAADDRSVVCGGSWYSRPGEARAATRRAHHPWQGVFDVGFRVVSQ